MTDTGARRDHRLSTVGIAITSAALAGCGPKAPADTNADPGDHFVLAGGTVVGVGVADVEVRDGRIVAVGTVGDAPATVDVSGRWLVPAVIDSHVHLAYLDDVPGMADGGVAGAVDWAAPLPWLAQDHAPLRIVASGPMVTAVDGYPTQSWGSGGYGLEVADAEAARAAVGQLRDAGAGVIKLPVTAAPVLDDAALAAAVDEAHALGLKVGTHALSDEHAARAAAAGVDVLVHAPTERLSDATLDAWAGRTVIPTLRAFGSGPDAVANVAGLRERGAVVLYGTDFGNSRVPGVDAGELQLLLDAGLDPQAVLAAATSAPASAWGLDDLGAIEAGRAASLLVLPRDPLVDPLVLAEPERVYLDGAAR